MPSAPSLPGSQGCKLPHPNHGHVVLAKPSPILFYPIASNEVRCLVDVPGGKLPQDLPQYLRTTVAPEVRVSWRQGVTWPARQQCLHVRSGMWQTHVSMDMRA